MADLMTDTYTFDALKDKYEAFCIPLIKIKAGGSDLAASMKLSIVDIKVSLSLDTESMVVFRIGGLYDEESHTFNKEVKSRFVLGEVMEVELGYLSDSLNIFKGYVAMLGAEFGENPMLVVTLMDVRHLMKNSGNTYMLHEVVNYSDVFKTIIGKYSKLCAAEIDATDDHLEQPLSQTVNDYLFVTKELIQSGKANREFFVLGDTVYFRKPRKIIQPVMTLQYGRELLELKVDEAYQDIKVEVIGYDGSAQTVIQAEGDVTTDQEQKKLLSATQPLTFIDSSVDTQKKADTKAESIAEEKKWKVRTGYGVTLGLPELVPGRFVCVEALETNYADHKYYIKNVVHEITQEEFRTTFEIGGWI